MQDKLIPPALCHNKYHKNKANLRREKKRIAKKYYKIVHILSLNKKIL